MRPISTREVREVSEPHSFYLRIRSWHCLCLSSHMPPAASRPSPPSTKSSVDTSMDTVVAFQGAGKLNVASSSFQILTSAESHMLCIRVRKAASAQREYGYYYHTSNFKNLGSLYSMDILLRTVKRHGVYVPQTSNPQKFARPCTRVIMQAIRTTNARFNASSCLSIHILEKKRAYPDPSSEKRDAPTTLLVSSSPSRFHLLEAITTLSFRNSRRFFHVLFD